MKIGFLSLGCPKNLVDGEVMLGLAREAGHEITSDASDAEAIVINTLMSHRLTLIHLRFLATHRACKRGRGKVV